MIKKVSTGYRPRRHQEELHRSLKRFNVLVCHRRFGKTHFAVNEIIDRAFRCTQPSPQFAYIAPTYGQAKRVVWDILKEYLKDIPGVTTNESDLRIEIQRPAQRDKIKILLLGAENPGSVRGIYLDGVVLDEFAEADPTIWSQVVRPALSDRLGWALFIGTPKGTNAFYDLYQFAKNGDPENNVPPQPDWFAATYKASDTGIVAKAELEAARATMSEPEYAQEFECSFSAALVGAYYGREMEAAEADKRITSVSYDPALPCYTAWDLGIDDTTAIWFFQKLRDQEVRVIDYLEMSGMGLDWYIKELSKKPYTYEEHFLPHDAAARELGTGKTRQEMLRTKGLGARTRIVPKQSVEDGINAVRTMLPKCWFDAVKCARGISSLKNYERAWDAKNKIFQARPKHNWASHGADAFRTFAMAISGFGGETEKNKKRPRQAQSDFSIL